MSFGIDKITFYFDVVTKLEAFGFFEEFWVSENKVVVGILSEEFAGTFINEPVIKGVNRGGNMAISPVPFDEVVVFGHVTPSKTEIEWREFVGDRTTVVTSVIYNETPRGIFSAIDDGAGPIVALDTFSASGGDLRRRKNAFFGTILTVKIWTNEGVNKNPNDEAKDENGAN